MLNCSTPWWDSNGSASSGPADAVLLHQLQRLLADWCHRRRGPTQTRTPARAAPSRLTRLADRAQLRPAPASSCARQPGQLLLTGDFWDGTSGCPRLQHQEPLAPPGARRRISRASTSPGSAGPRGATSTTLAPRAAGHGRRPSSADGTNTPRNGASRWPTAPPPPSGPRSCLGSYGGNTPGLALECWQRRRHRLARHRALCRAPPRMCYQRQQHGHLRRPVGTARAPAWLRGGSPASRARPTPSTGAWFGKASGDGQHRRLRRHHPGRPDPRRRPLSRPARTELRPVAHGAPGCGRPGHVDLGPASRSTLHGLDLHHPSVDIRRSGQAVGRAVYVRTGGEHRRRVDHRRLRPRGRGG